MKATKRRTSDSADGGIDEAGNRPVKRARKSSDDSIPMDRLQHLLSFLVEERREAAAKALTAQTIGIPRIMEQLVSLRNRLENRQMQEFLDDIASAMEAMMICMSDLTEWIVLAIPPTFTSDDSSLLTKEMALAAITQIQGRCLINLNKIPEHHAARDVWAEEAGKRKLPDECPQKHFEPFDGRRASEWKVVTDRLLGDCEKLVNFINQHRQFLEKTDDQLNDAKNMYL